MKKSSLVELGLAKLVLVLALFQVAIAQETVEVKTAPSSMEKLDQAQPPDDERAIFFFVETRPRDVFLKLDDQLAPEMKGKRLSVRITEAGGCVWLLPVYVLKEVHLPEKPSDHTTAEIVLWDVLYHDKLESAVVQSMDAQYGPEKWKPATPNANRVAVTLRIKEGDVNRPLGTAKFIREVGQGQVVLTFPLSEATADRLATADRSSLGLTFEETTPFKLSLHACSAVCVERGYDR